MKKLLFNRYSFLIFVLNMLPTMFADASLLNSSDDKYTLDVIPDDVVYIDLSKIKTQPIVPTSGGPKRSASRQEFFVDAWLQNGSLYFCADFYFDDIEVTITDIDGNIVCNDCKNVCGVKEACFDLHLYEHGIYTLCVIIDGMSYQGNFEL